MSSYNCIEPIVSIIIPLYNVQLKYFEECVKSLLRQTNDDFEVVIVNDGSTDAFFRQYMGIILTLDSRFNLINQDNMGTYEARRTGVENARGRYILFLDADDYLRCDAVEKVSRAAVSEAPDLITYRLCSNASFIPDNATHFFSTSSTESDLSTMKAELLVSDRINHVITKVVKRSIAERIPKQGNRLIYAEDKLYCAYVFDEASSVVAIDEVLYFYRFSSDGITKRGFSPLKLENLLSIHSLLEEFLLKWHLEEQRPQFDALLLSQICAEISSCVNESQERLSHASANLISDARFLSCCYGKSFACLPLHRRLVINALTKKRTARLWIYSKIFLLVQKMLQKLRSR